MTEADWLGCTDPKPMLEHLRGKAGDRKLRLFAAACCRRVPGALIASSPSAWLAVCEGYAEGNAAHQEWERALGDVREAEYQAWCCGFVPNTEGQRGWLVERPLIQAVWAALEGHAAGTAEAAVEAVLNASGTWDMPAREELKAREQAWQSRLLRCTVRNPFCQAPLDPMCLTSAVVSLAWAAYDERLMPSGEVAPERLSALADALEDAGCTCAEMLSHLRGPGPHVRGCWPVDLLLKKE